MWDECSCEPGMCEEWDILQPFLSPPKVAFPQEREICFVLAQLVLQHLVAALGFAEIFQAIISFYSGLKKY